MLSRYTYLIAEAASTHDGHLGQARELVRIAARSGFNAVKFQYWSDADAHADRRRVGTVYREIYRKYQVPSGWLPLLRDCAREYGLDFLCTVYMPEDIAAVSPFVARYKIASFEAADVGFVRAHGSDRPVIVSTGMMDPIDVYRLSQVENVTHILHCTSAYPCPIPDANLLAIKYLKQECPYHVVGFSDHTQNTLTGALAVMLGAEVVEVHICPNNVDRHNPDAAVSLRPDEAHQYVANIRLAERAKGSPIKKQQPVEADMVRYRIT